MLACLLACLLKDAVVVAGDAGQQRGARPSGHLFKHLGVHLWLPGS